MLEDVLTTDLGNAQELMRKPPRPLRRPDSDDTIEHAYTALNGALPHMPMGVPHPLDGQHGLGFYSAPPRTSHER